MAINTTVLCTKLGRSGKLLYLCDTLQAGIDAAVDDVLDEYDGSDRFVTAPLIQAVDAIKANCVSALNAAVEVAQSTLLKIVYDDKPQASVDIGTAIGEVITQMRAQSETVKRCTVTAVATALTGNIGTGQIVVTAARGDGLPQENIIAETALVSCAADSYGVNGTITAGVEDFVFAGAPQTAGELDYNFQNGSAASLGFSAISPDTTGDAGTQITNGDFETFTVADTPDDWTITVGTPGTHLINDTSVFYTGESSLKIPGSATLLNISQELAAAAPLNAYCVHFWIRVDSTPAAGVMTIDLYSATTGAVVADAQAVNNSTTVSLTGLTGATWTPQSAVFRMPKNPPADTALRIRMTTALTTGRYANIDRVCIAPVSVPYSGGPGICVFSGATPFVVGDGWSLAVANNRGGATYGATFQTLFDRFFDMRNLGAVLPSDASPTQADTLITS